MPDQLELDVMRVLWLTSSWPYPVWLFNAIIWELELCDTAQRPEWQQEHYYGLIWAS